MASFPHTKNISFLISGFENLYIKMVMGKLFVCLCVCVCVLGERERERGGSTNQNIDQNQNRHPIRLFVRKISLMKKSKSVNNSMVLVTLPKQYG